MMRKSSALETVMKDGRWKIVVYQWVDLAGAFPFAFLDRCQVGISFLFLHSTGRGKWVGRYHEKVIYQKKSWDNY